MEPNQVKPKVSAGDFFLNLGATVALYTTVFSLLRVLFTAIDSKFPTITNGYQYYSPSISWPVAVLVIFFPIFILLMWIIGKNYEADPQRRNSGVHKWLTYLTLFITGLVLAGDLIAVLYYFIDGQQLTTAFLLKVLSLLVVAGSVFTYYLADIRGKLTTQNRNMWRIFAFVLVVLSIAWGFMVLGSPYTQRMYKYDMQKVSDLQNLNSQIQSYYSMNSKLPANLDALKEMNYHYVVVDSQTNAPYEYVKSSETSYSLCAVFNRDSRDGNNSEARPYYYEQNWSHPAGRHCFTQKINPAMFPSKPLINM